MANYYSNLTVVADRDSLPSKLERFDDVTHLFDPLTSTCLVCHSANWLAFSLGKVADNDFGTEEPLCTIGFLKSHLEVLRIAMRAGSHAIHAQS